MLEEIIVTHVSYLLEHILGRKDRAVHLQYLLLEDEEVPPLGDDVGLQCTPHWSKVELTRNTCGIMTHFSLETFVGLNW